MLSIFAVNFRDYPDNGRLAHLGINYAIMDSGSMGWVPVLRAKSKI